MEKSALIAAFLGGLFPAGVALMRGKGMDPTTRTPTRPGPGTFDVTKLPDNPAINQLAPNKRAWILKLAVMARKAQVMTGIPASVALAQSIQEGGAGQSGLDIHNKNHFGLKTGGASDASKPITNCPKSPMGPLDVAWTGSSWKTQERVNGRTIVVYSCFRKYASSELCVLDWALRFYRRAGYDPGIKAALSHRRSGSAFIRAGGLNSYATDEIYRQKLLRHIATYNLEVYDVPVEHWNLIPAVAAIAPVPK